MLSKFEVQKENEYSVKEVETLTGWGNSKVVKLAKEGRIKRTRFGYYCKESVDAYLADIAERKGITPAEWVKRGNLV